VVKEEHAMSKMLTILIAILIVFAAFSVLHYAKDKTSTSNGMEDEAIMQSNHGTPEFQAWREFSPPSGAFKILFPTLPQHAADIILDAKTKESHRYDTFVAADDLGQAFMLNLITYPHAFDPMDIDEILKSVVSDMLSRNKANKLKTMNLGLYRNNKALDFTIENGDKTVIGKIFAAGDTIYVLSLIGREDSHNHQELEFFINSLSFVGEKASTKIQNLKNK